MANKEHLKILNKGVATWNAWRRKHPNSLPNLRGANLAEANLENADLSLADLEEANLSEANLAEADLSDARLAKANVSGAQLFDAVLWETDLRDAKICGAKLLYANLSEAKMIRSDLSEALLTGAQLVGTDLSGANLSDAEMGWTILGDIDLSTSKGLESVTHAGPSTIGVDTLYRSRGRIPEVFLRGAGVPEEFITQIPALVASVSPIQFQSCFISYSHRDEEFAKRLHAAMRAENLRVWFAPEEMKGGKKLHEQIFQAIQVHDRLLLVLSTESMKSEWVITEIKRAKKVEREENRRKLFPIRLVDFETIQNWECFDADSGKDLAAEVREYYIPDFTNWKDHDSFEREFAKLLRDLKATEKWIG
jgi:TIR domain/Pentapeptide repeats (8 copies)